MFGLADVIEHFDSCADSLEGCAGLLQMVLDTPEIKQQVISTYLAKNPDDEADQLIATITALIDDLKHMAVCHERYYAGLVKSRSFGFDVVSILIADARGKIRN